MTKTSYFLKVSGQELNASILSCTGEQLVLIVDCVRKYLSDYDWYSADVSTMSSNKEWEIYKSEVPKLIGGSTKLIKFAEVTDQFTSGVFLAANKKYRFMGFSNTYETEDEQYIDIEFCELEIRAFDTSYFEIYSKERKFIDVLADRFVNEYKGTL